MADYDNTVVLYDEDGEEIEFEILHSVTYEGVEYLVLWSEDTDDMVVVYESNGDYEIVDDDDVLDYVKESFSGSMNSLMEEVEAFATEKDFMEELKAVAEGHAPATDELPDEPQQSNPSVSVHTVSFNKEKYIEQSQDFLFRDAQNKYAALKYEEALSTFIEADKEGNLFAAAHIGMMYHYGEGCKKDDAKAYEFFNKGAANGCPLAAAWKAEFHRVGYFVEKNKELGAEMYKAIEPALKEMCAVEDVSALYFLGYNLIMGIGCEVDDFEGVRLLETAVYKGDAKSAIQLADCYFNGWGVARNEEKAVELLQTHPAEGHKKYHYLLGRCYYHGAGIEQDYSRAFSEFEKSARLGFGKGKDYLGDCYYYGHGTEKDLYEAARWYKDAADNNGIGNSAHSLAFMYLNGEGVPENQRKAVEYFQIAAECGIVQAQRIISQEYISGDILPRDYEKAREWMEKAAIKGDPQAQLMLGRYYVSGFGFDSDQKAFEWFEKAAEQGDAEAEYTLGGCYIYDIYVQQDARIANQWFERAAEKEHPKAMHELGVSYLTGRGIVQNTEKGLSLLSHAAEKGAKESCEYLVDYYSGVKSQHKDMSAARIYAQKLVEIEPNADSLYRLAAITQECGDFETAKRHYQEAISSGNELAKVALSKLYIKSETNYFEAFSMLSSFASSKNGEAQYLLAFCYENGFGCEKDKKVAKNLYQLAKVNGFTEELFPKKKRFGLF